MRGNKPCHYERPFYFDCRTDGQSYQKQDAGTPRPFRRLRRLRIKRLPTILKRTTAGRLWLLMMQSHVSRMLREQRFTARHFYWWMNTTVCCSIIHSAIMQSRDYWNKHPVSQVKPIFRQRQSGKSFYWMNCKASPK